MMIVITPLGLLTDSIGLIGIHFFNETAGRPIDGTTPPGSEDEKLAEMGYDLIDSKDNPTDGHSGIGDKHTLR